MDPGLEYAKRVRYLDFQAIHTAADDDRMYAMYKLRPLKGSEHIVSKALLDVDTCTDRFP